MKYTKELKVGISVLLAVATLYLGVRYLKGSDVFSSSHHYYLKYPATEALEVSHPVLIHGIVVGQVDNLQLVPESYSVEVRINVSGDINIPRGTIGELQSSSLLGGKSIALILSEERNHLHEDEDTLKSRIKQGLGDLFTQPNTQKDLQKTIEKPQFVCGISKYFRPADHRDASSNRYDRSFYESSFKYEPIAYRI